MITQAGDNEGMLDNLMKESEWGASTDYIVTYKMIERFIAT
jgi:hypothetical protein